uniref:Uncharacterized protein n=1 Tax=Arundo donax TaxID=35708 RepID=A0A0A9FH34_ARUDO
MSATEMWMLIVLHSLPYLYMLCILMLYCGTMPVRF